MTWATNTKLGRHTVYVAVALHVLTLTSKVQSSRSRCYQMRCRREYACRSDCSGFPVGFATVLSSVPTSLWCRRDLASVVVVDFRSSAASDPSIHHKFSSRSGRQRPHSLYKQMRRLSAAAAAAEAGWSYSRSHGENDCRLCTSPMVLYHGVIQLYEWVWQGPKHR